MLPFSSGKLTHGPYQTAWPHATGAAIQKYWGNSCAACTGCLLGSARSILDYSFSYHWAVHAMVNDCMHACLGEHACDHAYNALLTRATPCSLGGLFDVYVGRKERLVLTCL